MRRRDLMIAAAATLAAPLAAPRLGRAAAATTLRFIPQSDLTILDPHWTTAYVTRNHGYMVFDTLYGSNGRFEPSPQMLAGHVIEDDGKLWTLSLRDGLLWHDGTPVLARDCVASIRRWAQRDAFGQALMAATDELSAKDDKRIVFRLKRPFPLLPNALGKSGSPMAAMMPERLASAEVTTQVKEIVGSGPFRFLADERVPGARAVYAKFDRYLPREGGTPDWTAGPKHAYFERVEWTTIPDPATASAALQNGEQDWWEYASGDLLPMLRRQSALKVTVPDKFGTTHIMRFNHLFPPFDNPAIRRAVLGAVVQSDYMQAVAGDDPAMWHDGVGFFCPNSAMASDAGMEAITGKRDIERSKRELAAAGYKGERVALMVQSDYPTLKALCDVTADLLGKLGMNVDYQSTDWGTVVQRRAKRDPIDKGGWNIFCTGFSSSDLLNPAGHLPLRGNGAKAWFGWPDNPKLETLRDAWFAAPDLAAQKKICEDIQREAFISVPYIPLGSYLQATAYNSGLTGMLDGFSMFWNLRRG
jgi:peptide/nickel transport system substrate-binding protein